MKKAFFVIFVVSTILMESTAAIKTRNQQSIPDSNSQLQNLAIRLEPDNLAQTEGFLQSGIGAMAGAARKLLTIMYKSASSMFRVIGQESFVATNRILRGMGTGIWDISKPAILFPRWGAERVWNLLTDGFYKASEVGHDLYDGALDLAKRAGSGAYRVCENGAKTATDAIGTVADNAANSVEHIVHGVGDSVVVAGKAAGTKLDSTEESLMDKLKGKLRNIDKSARKAIKDESAELTPTKEPKSDQDRVQKTPAQKTRRLSSDEYEWNNGRKILKHQHGPGHSGDSSGHGNNSEHGGSHLGQHDPDDSSKEGYYSTKGHIYWEGQNKINYIKGDPSNGVEDCVEYYNPDGGLDRVEHFSSHDAATGSPDYIQYFKGAQAKN